jgi:hypothetical protein
MLLRAGRRIGLDFASFRRKRARLKQTELKAGVETPD